MSTNHMEFVALHDHLCRSRSGVVVGTHCRPVGTDRLNHEQISRTYRQSLTPGEKIRCLTNGTDNIICRRFHVGRRHFDYPMVRTVERRPQQIIHRRIHDCELVAFADFRYSTRVNSIPAFPTMARPGSIKSGKLHCRADSCLSKALT